MQPHAAHPEPRDLARLFDDAIAALDRARPDVPATVEPALRALAALQEHILARGLTAEEHARVRGRIDTAMTRLGVLLDGTRRSLASTGRELARVRARLHRGRSRPHFDRTA